MAELFGRKATLLVGDETEQQDLSALHLKFKIEQWDLQTPNRAQIRVYNVSDATRQRVQKEFTTLSLQAGYENGPFGLVFKGTLVQARRGRESPADTYLDLTGADGDAEMNFAVVSTSVKAGSTFKDRVDLLAKAMVAQTGYVPDLPSSKLPRGVVMYGMARDYLRDEAVSTDTKPSIQQGALQMVPLDGYLPDEAVVLTSATGMVGLPEQTNDGIRVRCLLNPNIKPGARVQIDNASIQQAGLNLGIQGASQNAFLPSIADDGFYRVVVNTLTGDTRGQDWYNDLICIAVGQAVTPGLVARGYS